MTNALRKARLDEESQSRSHIFRRRRWLKGEYDIARSYFGEAVELRSSTSHIFMEAASESTLLPA